MRCDCPTAAAACSVGMSFGLPAQPERIKPRGDRAGRHADDLATLIEQPCRSRRRAVSTRAGSRRPFERRERRRSDLDDDPLGASKCVTHQSSLREDSNAFCRRCAPRRLRRRLRVRSCVSTPIARSRFCSRRTARGLPIGVCATSRSTRSLAHAERRLPPASRGCGPQRPDGKRRTSPGHRARAFARSRPLRSEPIRARPGSRPQLPMIGTNRDPRSAAHASTPATSAAAEIGLVPDDDADALARVRRRTPRPRRRPRSDRRPDRPPRGRRPLRARAQRSAWRRKRRPRPLPCAAPSIRPGRSATMSRPSAPASSTTPSPGSMVVNG